MEDLKKKVIEVEELAKQKTSKKALKQLEELQRQFKHLSNKRKEALIAILQKYKIKIDGGEAPEPIETFQKMQKLYGWSDGFMRRLSENECFKPTPVQIQAIPTIVAKKSSVILAETGSGKSLAFIAPLLH